MTPDEIHKTVNGAVALALKEQLPIAVNDAVNASVNGKIAKLQHDMQPVIDSFNTWSGWRKGMTAIFLPLSTAIGFTASIALILTFFFKK